MNLEKDTAGDYTRKQYFWFSDTIGSSRPSGGGRIHAKGMNKPA
jgi:hypothetical protein